MANNRKMTHAIQKQHQSVRVYVLNAHIFDKISTIVANTPIPSENFISICIELKVLSHEISKPNPINCQQKYI